MDHKNKSDKNLNFKKFRQNGIPVLASIALIFQLLLISVGLIFWGRAGGVLDFFIYIRFTL